MEPPPALVRVLSQTGRGAPVTALDIPMPAVLLEQRRRINTLASEATCER